MAIYIFFVFSSQNIDSIPHQTGKEYPVKYCSTCIRNIYLRLKTIVGSVPFFSQYTYVPLQDFSQEAFY